MKLIENAPWWLVSAGIHAVLILGAALICVERLMAIDGPTCPVVVRPPEPERIPIDKERDLATREGIPLKTEATDSKIDPDEKVIWFPGAQYSDKNRSKETDPDLIRDDMRGQDKKFLSSLPGDSGAHTGRQLKGFGSAENIGTGR